MKELPTVAISLWLPWAWAIMHAGKDIENRSNGKRRFPQAPVRRCWIHASLWPGTRKPLNRSGQEDLLAEFSAMFEKAALAGLRREQMPPLSLGAADALRGKILGSVTVNGYVTESPSVWFVPGSLGIQVADPAPLAVPIEAAGALGWWNVKQETLAQLREVA